MSSKCKLAMARSLAGLDCTLQSCASARPKNGTSSPNWIWHHKNKSTWKQTDGFWAEGIISSSGQQIVRSSRPKSQKLSFFMFLPINGEANCESQKGFAGHVRDTSSRFSLFLSKHSPLPLQIDGPAGFRVGTLLLHSNSSFTGSTYSIFSSTSTDLHPRWFAIPWRTWSLANHHQGLQLPLLQWLLALQGCPCCRRRIQIGHALQVWKVTLMNYKWKISSSWTISPSQGNNERLLETTGHCQVTLSRSGSLRPSTAAILRCSCCKICLAGFARQWRKLWEMVLEQNWYCIDIDSRCTENPSQIETSQNFCWDPSLS